MNIYFYSDESGVFDKKHYDYFAFGGVVILASENKEYWKRRYLEVEESINSNQKYGQRELKASAISVKDKNRIINTLNRCYKFGVIIRQKELLDNVYEFKKTKQRYLDYAYKYAVVNVLSDLIKENKLDPTEVKKMYFNCDDHCSATDARYELNQILEEALRIGEFNDDYTKFNEPLLPELEEVSVEFCDSKTKTLVRAADIIANHLFNCALGKRDDGLVNMSNLYLYYLPVEKE